MNREPETPKPKRRYTLTDKAREARRISLAKAREKARHALRGYRRGAHEDALAYETRLGRQIKPWCANLGRAVAAKKADRSAHYASQFTHGLTAPDLDRSAAAAGEDRDELRRHIERCQRVIGGLAGLTLDDNRLPIDRENGNSKLENRNSDTSNREPATDNRNSDTDNRQPATDNQSNRQSKLVLALAYVLWRALRLLRTQVRWERRVLAFRLQELAGWRQRHPALTAERLNQLRHDLEGVTGDLIFAGRRLARLHKRFEALWTALFDPERWARLGAHILDPSGVPNEPTYMACGLGLLDLLAGRAGGVRGRGRAGLGARASPRSAPDGRPADRDGEGNPDRPDGHPGRTPRPRAPRNPFATRWDPLKHLCRTRSQGAQDWRLRLDRLTAATLSQPFESPANVERALRRQAAAAQAGERRRGNSADGGSARSTGSERPRGSRARNVWARFPDDGLLASLAGIGVLVNITSLSMLRTLLAQGLGTGDSGETAAARTAGPWAGQAGASPGPTPEIQESGQELAALAEALWTRLEGFGVLVETLEEMLVRMLEYHALGARPSWPPPKSGQDARAPREAPTFDALLESKKARLSNPEGEQEKEILRGVYPERDDPEILRCAQDDSERAQDDRSGDLDRAAGLRLNDLWIDTDLFLPDATPLDGVRLWWEAADGVLGAGSRFAQKVDVALYEFAVRRFGIRGEFVAWRPELSLNQSREREGRPEWAPRVTTVDGKVLLKVGDEEVRELRD